MNPIFFALLSLSLLPLAASAVEKDPKKIEECLKPKPPTPPGPVPPAPIQVTFKKGKALSLAGLKPEGSLTQLRTALATQAEYCKTAEKNHLMRVKTATGVQEVTLTPRQYCLEPNQKLVELAQRASTYSNFLALAAKELDWYESNNEDREGGTLFTGYNVPLMEGSIQPNLIFSFPLYNKPTDLVEIVDENGKKVTRRRKPDGTFVPYYTREEIDVGGVLRGQNLEVGYIKNRLEAVLLQVEGSGVVLEKQSDGSTKRWIMNYAAQNGYRGVTLAKIMKCMELPRDTWATKDALRKYFKANPDELAPILTYDPSYVFFQVEDQGPYGYIRLILTPRHSVAVDPEVLPLGGVTFINTRRPGEKTGSVPFQTLALNQDIGGAIKGSHIDVFWGEDDYAVKASNNMSFPGKVFLALPKGLVE